jgi:TPR repeat protein
MMPFHYRKSSFLRTLALALLVSVFHGAVAAADLWDQLFRDNLENAEAGQVDAQYEVGIMYLKGQGVKQNREKAAQWLKSAADSGHDQAAAKLRRMQDKQKKFAELVKKAESGDAAVQHEVAMMYLKGIGVAMNEHEARKWLAKAADQGHQKSITRLGIVSYKGENSKPDYKQALKMFNQVKEDDVLAQYFLGEMYAAGKGVKRDYSAAIGWYKKAADGGFNRAHGKIINLEEELEIQQRRKANTAKRAKAKEQPKKTVKKKAQKPVVAKAKPVEKKTAKARKKSTPVAKQSVLDRLAAKHWMRRGKPVEYLPSLVTSCDMEDPKLVCFTQVLSRTTGFKTIQYRVKSIIREDKGKIVVSYRNLVLDVTSAEPSDEGRDEQLGYDDEAEKGFQVKTGWTKKHQVSCSISSKSKLDCLKDNTHKMAIVEGMGETKVAR